MLVISIIVISILVNSKTKGVKGSSETVSGLSSWTVGLFKDIIPLTYI